MDQEEFIHGRYIRATFPFLDEAIRRHLKLLHPDCIGVIVRDFDFLFDICLDRGKKNKGMYVKYTPLNTPPVEVKEYDAFLDFSVDYTNPNNCWYGKQ